MTLTFIQTQTANKALDFNSQSDSHVDFSTFPIFTSNLSSTLLSVSQSVIFKYSIYNTSIVGRNVVDNGDADIDSLGRSIVSSAVVVVVDDRGGVYAIIHGFQNDRYSFH